MNFLYLYDLVNFNEKGELVSTETYQDKNKVASNFIYMICKYNQNLLCAKAEKNGEKAELPAFFKQDLSSLLEKLESGEISKEYALIKIAPHCLDEIKDIINRATSDREIIERLNSLVNVNSGMFAKKFNKAGNKKHLEYIMTVTAGNLMNEITSALPYVEENSKYKSKVYKSVIEYNGLVGAVNSL